MWEAFEYASDAGLDNLTAIIDVNRLGQRGETRHGWDLGKYSDRARAFGWHAIEIDGHDFEQVDAAYAEAVRTTGRPTVIVARTVKGSGVAVIANQDGFHGKPLDDADGAVAELGGVRGLSVDVSKPEGGRAPHAFASEPVDSPQYDMGDTVATRRAYGDALAALGDRTRRRGGPRRRGEQLDLCGRVRRGPPRPLLRDVHRRAAARRLVDRDAGARLDPVRVHLRGVLRARLRLRQDGRSQRSKHQVGRLPRGRVDRRGWAVADGPGGPGVDEGGPRQHRPLPVGRQPGRGPGPADGRPRGDRLYEDDPRAHARDLSGRGRVPDWGQRDGALFQRRRRDDHRRWESPCTRPRRQQTSWRLAAYRPG